jgi:hypothetical protein
MKILFIKSRSTGVLFFNHVISYLPTKYFSVRVISIREYLSFDERGFDCIIYNTFPAESHGDKFDKNTVYAADIKFHNFKGKKILFDSHDEGMADAYTRFNNSKLPRIKLTPGYDYYNKFDVILGIPFLVNKCYWSSPVYPKKTIPLLYCVGLKKYHHDIRQQVFEKIKSCSPYTKRHSLNEYSRILKSSGISIAVPGCGTGCYSHLETLSANTMLLAHDSIKKIDILPGSPLIDGQHYISFSLDNLQSILKDLLKNSDKVRQITLQGKELFNKNYSIERTATKLIKYLQQ